MMWRLAAVLMMAAPAAASQWAVVPGQSSIGFSAEWSGKTVEGRFPKFAANIRFDPQDLASARVSGVIDLSAATTGDRTVDGSLPGADWFDVKTSPTARLTLNRFTQTKAGSFVAQGSLSMRGATVPVSLPFTLTIKGDTATMVGETTLDRRAFKIGMDSDATASWVGFRVPIKVRIVANRVK